MKTLARTALLLVLAFLPGCNPSPNPALSGTWVFTLTPTEDPSNVIQATASLTQLGTNVTGPVNLTGNGFTCGDTATMTGTVQGNVLVLQLTQDVSSVGFNGTANQAFTSANGTYTVSTGPCLQNLGTGTWTAALN